MYSILTTVHLDELSFEFLPIKRDENDPFITGLDKMKIATTFPTTPRADTMDNKTPSMINVNMLLELQTKLLIFINRLIYLLILVKTLSSTIKIA